MKKITILLLFIFLTNTANILFAQKLPVPFPSPEAASLGTVGNVPVSLYTGRANIAIPLMEVQTGGYKLPVTLSYNSSGVMPDLRPGWVGQNWSLDVGGAITRSIKGLPDETETYGFCYSYNRIQSSDWSSNQNLQATQSSPFFLGSSPANYYDTEPDEFFFNANGISGKFYIGSDGKFKVASEPGIKVDCNFTVNDLKSIDGFTERTFWGFKITTQEGVVYHFGFDDKAIEFSGIYLQTSTPTKYYASSWLLTKIEIPNKGDTITFTYSPKKFDTTISSVELNISSAWNWDITKGWESHGGGCSSSGDQTYLSIISHTYLQSIEGSNFSLSFSTSPAKDLTHPAEGNSPNWQKLDIIRLNDKSSPSQIVKTFIFSYTANSGTRLFLDSVKEAGLPAYKFLYDSRKSLGYNLTSTDHWGYYNGSTLGSRISGTFTINNKNYFTLERETHPDNVKAGILTQIKYPTGGTVNFEFEANDYSQYCKLSNGVISQDSVDRRWSENWRNQVNGDLVVSNPVCVIVNAIPPSGYSGDATPKIYYLNAGTYRVSDFAKDVSYSASMYIYDYKELISSKNAFAGGVRIKKISYKDGDSEYSREYKYVKNFKLLNSPTVSSGILGSVPIYDYSININSKPLGTIYTGYYDASCSQPVSPLSLAEGIPVGYSEVAEVIKDKNENSLGYTVYKYTNFDSNPDSPPVNTQSMVLKDYGARNKNEVERGKLLFQTDYANTDIKVKEIFYAYKKIQRDGIKAIGNQRIFLTSCAMSNVVGYIASAYYFNNNSYLPEKETETVYDTSGNNPVATATGYSYNANNLVSESSTINSDNINYKTSYKYPTDFSTTNPYDEMIGKNMLNPIVQKTTYKGASTVTVEKNNYDKFQSVFYAPANKQIQNGNNSLETREVYTYDSKSNLRQVTKDNADNTVYLWGYNYQYPITEIKGVAYSDVTNKISEASLNAISVKSEPDVADWTTINNLRTQLPNALVTTYTYKPLVGIQTMTDPRGVVTKYDYDSFGRLIKVTRADKVIETYEYHYKN